MPSRLRSSAAILAIASLSIWFCNPIAALADDVDRIAAIDSQGANVAITLTSSREFRVRALPLVLRVGDKTFSRSRYPEDGRLDTLIFYVPASEFAELSNGDRVTIHYGSTPRSADAPDVWDFGLLDKSLASE